MTKNEGPKYIFSDDGEYRFQVVDVCPLGYHVWNINANTIPGYLPFCRLRLYQRFSGGRQIEVATLKAVRCDHAEEIIRVTSMGYYTPQEVEAVLERARAGKAELLDSTIEALETALPYMEALPWPCKKRR